MNLLRIFEQMDDVEKSAMLQEVRRHCKERMVMGSRKYGVWDPRKDDRDLFQEMENELLDFRNYATMMIIKLRLLKGELTMETQETLFSYMSDDEKNFWTGWKRVKNSK